MCPQRDRVMESPLRFFKRMHWNFRPAIRQHPEPPIKGDRFPANVLEKAGRTDNVRPIDSESVMHIAQIATLSAPVRRETGGSVESLIWLLTRELIRLGHQVTVFATAGSEVDGELVATLAGPYGAEGSLDDWQ